MIQIQMSSHDFEKVNLVTICRGKQIYDIYRCKACGLTGKRHGLKPFIEVARDKKGCEYKKSKKDTVFIPHNPQLVSSFGLVEGTYQIVFCPKDLEEKYADDIWVFSKQRQEPVRLLVGEYEFR